MLGIDDPCVKVTKRLLTTPLKRQQVSGLPTGEDERMSSCNVSVYQSVHRDPQDWTLLLQPSARARQIQLVK